MKIDKFASFKNFALLKSYSLFYLKFTKTGKNVLFEVVNLKTLMKSLQKFKKNVNNRKWVE